MRAHNTPTTYSQPWHCDSAQWSRYFSLPVGERGAQPAIQAHTTFYLDTLTPETGYLKLPPGALRQAESLVFPENGADSDTMPFGVETKVYPEAGSVVVFLSHLPHRGENRVAGLSRRNIVCLYGPAGSTEQGVP